MKRKNIIFVIFSIVLLVLIIIGIVFFNNDKPNYSDYKENDVVAEIGDEKILKKDVDNRILAIKINYEASKQALYNSFDEETANSLAKQIKNPPSFEEELNNMVESAKIRRYLKQINKELTYNEAKELTDKNILNDSTARARKIALELLEKDGITEETYTKSIYSSYYDFWCQNKLFEYFKDNIYDASLKNTLQEQYKNYFKSIIAEPIKGRFYD